jgi:hypothetical protein
MTKRDRSIIHSKKRKNIFRKKLKVNWFLISKLKNKKEKGLCLKVTWMK